MMIWLTQISFGRTAQDLSDEHLAKLIEDYDKLVDHLSGEKDLPKKNPVRYAWEGRLEAAIIGGMMTSLEFTNTRRYDDQVFWKFSKVADSLGDRFSYHPVAWFRDKDVIRSHRSALKARYPQVYGEKWPQTPTRMPILWPVVNPENPAVYELRVSREDLPLVRSGKLKIPAEISERVVNL